MQQRVQRYYDHNLVDAAYAAIYARHKEAASRPVARG
jgi:hypothetical protein